MAVSVEVVKWLLTLRAVVTCMASSYVGSVHIYSV